MAPRQTAAEKAAEQAAKDAEAQAQVAEANTEANTEAPEKVEANDQGETPSEADPTKIAKRAMPTYGLTEGMDDLPDQAPRATRDQMYVNLLSPIVEDENKWGKWFGVATFKTPTGANEARKAIEKGEREIPKGQWEIAARRIEPELAEGETTKHKRWSRLFVRFMGEEVSETDGEGSEASTTE